MPVMCIYPGCRTPVGVRPHARPHARAARTTLCSKHFDQWYTRMPHDVCADYERCVTALADFIRLAHAEANALTPEERGRCVQPLGPVAQTFTPEEEQPPRRLNHCVASGLSVTLCGDPPTFNEDNRINCPKCLRQLAQKA